MKTTDETDGPMLLTLRTTADYLGLSTWALRKAVREGKIPVVRFPGGKKFYFDRKDVEAFIQKNKFRFE